MLIEIYRPAVPSDEPGRAAADMLRGIASDLRVAYTRCGGRVTHDGQEVGHIVLKYRPSVAVVAAFVAHIGPDWRVVTRD